MPGSPEDPFSQIPIALCNLLITLCYMTREIPISSLNNPSANCVAVWDQSGRDVILQVHRLFSFPFVVCNRNPWEDHWSFIGCCCRDAMMQLTSLRNWVDDRRPHKLYGERKPEISQSFSDWDCHRCETEEWLNYSSRFSPGSEIWAQGWLRRAFPNGCGFERWSNRSTIDDKSSVQNKFTIGIPLSIESVIPFVCKLPVYSTNYPFMKQSVDSPENTGSQMNGYDAATDRWWFCCRVSTQSPLSSLFVLHYRRISSSYWGSSHFVSTFSLRFFAGDLSVLFSFFPEFFMTRVWVFIYTSSSQSTRTALRRSITVHQIRFVQDNNRHFTLTHAKPDEHGSCSCSSPSPAWLESNIAHLTTVQYPPRCIRVLWIEGQRQPTNQPIQSPM
jgi:hypothetical protein